MEGEGGAAVKGPSISDVTAVALQIRLEILKKKKQSKWNFEQGQALKFLAEK